MSSSDFPPTPPLRLIASAENADCSTDSVSLDLQRTGRVVVSVRVLRALDATLEILQAEHIARCDGDIASLLGEHLTDGLLVAARELVRASASPHLDRP